MIYVVIGETGEYSDRSYWLVKSYANEAKANEHAEAANTWLWKNSLHYGNQRDANYGRIDNPHDPSCRVDYTGAEYVVEALDFDPTV